MKNDSSFRIKVYELISQVPAGMVTTYGDVAARAGHAHAARTVGVIAHYGDESLPWHRLVNRFGGLAAGYYGGREVQATILESEGVNITPELIVKNFKEQRWSPNL